MRSEDEFVVEDQDAWLDGQNAARRGDTLEACPFESGPRRDAWLVAWLMTHSAPVSPQVPKSSVG